MRKLYSIIIRMQITEAFHIHMSIDLSFNCCLECINRPKICSNLLIEINNYWSIEFTNCTPQSRQ